MNQKTRNHIRNNIFLEELSMLKNEGLLSEEDYLETKQAYQTYYTAKSRSGPRPLALKKDPVLYAPKTIRRKSLSAQEVRDRNITMILVLGVLMVLLSGLILGTSNWEVMNAASKTASIAFVAMMFLAISIVSNKWLHILKTSYAFWILGSMFLPVAILSAGFFELFGRWFSIAGEGRFVLGMAATVICLPFYVFSAYKYKSRLFIWLSLLTLSTGAAFVIASLSPPVDIFYLCIVVYNSLLITAFMRLKNNTHFMLFAQEALPFIQVNLIISTLFILGFFDNHWIYGINIILTACLYGYLVFSQSSRGYSPVLSVLLIYGIYQIVTHTPAASMDFVLFSLVGFLFIGIEVAFKSDDRQKKIFRYTSGVVSMLTFIFILVNTLSGPSGRSVLLLTVSFLLISLNYFYLAYKTRQWLFCYLAPFFLMAAGYSLHGLEPFFALYPRSIHLFLLASIMFVLLYRMNNHKFLQTVKNSSGIVSLLSMFYGIIDAIKQQHFIISGILLYAFGLFFYFVYLDTGNKTIKAFVKWLLPVLWFWGMLLFFDKVKTLIYPGNTLYAFSLHFSISAFILFGWSLFWHRFCKDLCRSFSLISHILILMGVFWTQVLFAFSGYEIPIIFILSTAIYIYSMFRYKTEYLVKYFLYGVFILTTLTINAFFQLYQYDWHSYTILLVSFVLFLLYLCIKEPWKNRIVHFLIPFTSLAVFVHIFNPVYAYYDFWLILGFILMALFLNHKIGINSLNILPLGMLTLNILALDFYPLGLSDNSMLTIILLSFLILNTIGSILSQHLYRFPSVDKPGPISIDWYSLFALLHLLLSLTYSAPHPAILINMLPYIQLSCWLAFQIRRVENNSIQKVFVTLTAVSILLPYYELLGKINVPPLIITEVTVLPLIGLTAILTRKIWKGYPTIARRIELLVLLMVSAILLRDVLLLKVFYDGLILGVYSLGLIMIGLQVKAKSYFLTGTSCLVLNILLLTQRFWQSIPWWGYLLGAGMVLIITASMSEMQKNRRDKRTFKQSGDIMMRRFKNWQ